MEEIASLVPFYAGVSYLQSGEGWNPVAFEEWRETEILSCRIQRASGTAG